MDLTGAEYSEGALRPVACSSAPTRRSGTIASLQHLVKPLPGGSPDLIRTGTLLLLGTGVLGLVRSSPQTKLLKACTNRSRRYQFRPFLFLPTSVGRPALRPVPYSAVKPCDTGNAHAQRRDGEIGRRSGLKIRRPERVVGVQVPLPAPAKPRPPDGVSIILVRKIPIAPLTIAALLCLLAALGCGQFFPSSTTITAIQVLPSNAIVAPGVTQQYTATATFGNQSTGDVTSSVTWSTNATSIATISSGGLLTGVTLGTTTVQAKSGSVIGTTGVSIQNKTITSVSIQPLTQSLSVSGSGFPMTVQYTATATYQDSSTGDVTRNCTWNALPTSVVSINSTGLATAVAVGTATISATAQGVTSNSATVTVIQ